RPRRADRVGGGEALSSLRLSLWRRDDATDGSRPRGSHRVQPVADLDAAVPRSVENVGGHAAVEERVSDPGLVAAAARQPVHSADLDRAPGGRADDAGEV